MNIYWFFALNALLQFSSKLLHFASILLHFASVAHFGAIITIYCLDTAEIPGFLFSPKSHTFAARSEDTIFIFHM